MIYCLFIIDFDFGAILTFYSDHKHSLALLKAGDIHYKMTYLFQFLTWNTASDFKFTTMFMLVMFCYLLGHIIAAISSQVLEKWLNKDILGFPSENLFVKGKRHWFKRWFFKSYTKSFDDQFIDLFIEKFTARFGVINDKKTYFWLCFGEVAKHHPVAYNRVFHFLSLYGFSRNVSACFFIYTIVRLLLLSCTHLQFSQTNLFILIIYFAIGVIMYKNYLKLYYRQCAELYYHFYTMRTDTATASTNLNPAT